MHDGSPAGRRLEVQSELIVGRIDGDLVIEDVKLSRHAAFRASVTSCRRHVAGVAVPVSRTAPPPGRVEAPALPPVEPGPAAALSVFAPPAVRHGGLATRSCVPVALSYGSAIMAAAALVLYFVAR